MGDAIVGDVALALERLVELVPDSDRTPPPARPEPGDPPAADPPAGKLSGSEAMAALADAWPADGIAVLEAPSSTMALRNRLRISQPGSYYFGASGGLGFGISAAVGVQLAQPDRPVVCVLGEGSAQYGITALWSAVAYKAPVTFLVLRNEEYAILKWFSMLEQISGAPGLDLPALDVAAVARAYGMQAQDVTGREELTTRCARRSPPTTDPGSCRCPWPRECGWSDEHGCRTSSSSAPASPAWSPPTSWRRRAGKVLVLDQENRANLGGQAFWSLGGLFMVDTPEQRRFGIKDSLELALQDWLGSAGFDRERRGPLAAPVGGGVRPLRRHREARLPPRPRPANAAGRRLGRARRRPGQRPRQLGAALSH